MFQPEDIRKDFPVFKEHPDLIYFDNAATTQKPQVVIDAVSDFYIHYNANIHRGVYDIAAKATERYESVRSKVAHFIGAESQQNVVYTSGTTASINLVAQSYLANRLNAGDEVVISHMEHHANLIPWQMVCKARGAQLKIIPIDKSGTLDMGAFRILLSKRTKLVAVTHVSNTFGRINPVNEIIQIAHHKGIPVLLDGAQSVTYFDIDVQMLDVDFFVFSGHKLFGPTGIGILYAKKEHLSMMQPIVFGGDMIQNVSLEETSFLPPPQCFEAGTTNIAGVIGLGAAIDYLRQYEKRAIRDYLHKLRNYALDQMSQIEGFQLIGSRTDSSAIISFEIKGVHPHDVATILGAHQIAIRAGNHCTQPLMDFLNLPGTSRISFSIYNTMQEVDQMIIALKEVKELFG
jgi:cysteine desulfurase/selenocysteine lyase